MEKRHERPSYYTEKEHWAVKTSVVFMLLSMVLRIVGCWGGWKDANFAATQIALPLTCNIMFVLCIVFLGKHAFWSTSIPLLLGVIFFIIKSFTFTSWIHTFLCIILYMLVAALYSGTVFGIIRTKWLLLPLFGLPFLYHVFVEDLTALQNTANPVTFAGGMQEMSVLCIMLSLFFITFAMKKKPAQPPEQELPKMKAPKVIIPQRIKTEENRQEQKQPTVSSTCSQQTGNNTVSGESK